MGKGKEDTSSNNNASTSTNNTTSSSSSTSATQTTNASAAAGAAATQRRQPIGKVIHYFADNQSQGYDGLAFQEAYKTQVLAKVQALQDAKKNEKVDETDVEVKDEDVEMLVGIQSVFSPLASRRTTRIYTTETLLIHLNMLAPTRRSP
jgi:hypothetical protein